MSTKSKPLSFRTRVRRQLYYLSETYGWVTKLVTMLWLLESVLAVVFISLTAYTGALFGGPAAALVFWSLWIITGTPVYFWNKARKTRRHEAFDDRMSDEKMAKAREEVIAGFEKNREEETEPKEETE